MGALQRRRAQLTRAPKPTLVRADLRRSRVTDGHVSSGRTSFSTFLTHDKARRRRLVRKRIARDALFHPRADSGDAPSQASHPLVVDIERRLTDVVNHAHKDLMMIDEGPAAANQPVTSFIAAEPLQVVRYSVGQGTHPHRCGP
jgi:hypothetical protein